MKRAFLFSVIFILLFTVFLLLSVFYLRMLQMDALNLAQTKNITKSVYIADDIMSDLLDYLQLSVTVQSNSTNTILNISDVLPSPYTDPNGALSDYTSFITGIYSNQTNSLNSTNGSAIALNTTGFTSNASIFFLNSNSSLNLNYSYNNLSKNQLIINGSSLVTNYSVNITLNTTCLNSNCTNATWAGGPPNVDSSTVGMWHFDEGGSNTTTNDSSGKGNNGIIYGATWNSSGKYGKSLQFDGSSNYINISNSSSLTIEGNITISAWVKLNAFPTSVYIILAKDGTWSGTGTNYQLDIRESGKIEFAYRGSDGTANEFKTNNIVIAETNTWYHIAVTYDAASNPIIYVNGVSQPSSYVTGGIKQLGTNNNRLYIGALTGPSLFFNGTIDEVAIYNRTKSVDEIAADANLFHWDWSPTVTPLYVSINITDSLGSPVSLRGNTSGYVNSSANNTFYLKTDNNGNLNMTVGNYAGPYSCRIYVNNVTASLLFNIIENGTSSMQVVLPVQLQIYQQIFSNIIIAQK